MDRGDRMRQRSCNLDWREDLERKEAFLIVGANVNEEAFPLTAFNRKEVCIIRMESLIGKADLARLDLWWLIEFCSNLSQNGITVGHSCLRRVIFECSLNCVRSPIPTETLPLLWEKRRKFLPSKKSKTTPFQFVLWAHNRLIIALICRI